jgi:RNA polymerase sigma-70 factor (ECF subfamily)
MPETASATEAKSLLARMAQGDRRALARLIDLYGRGLQLYCARALAQANDAEDAAQEVFLKAWTHATRYDPARAAVSTWLYRIAVNHCTDRNRRHGFRRFLGLDAAPEMADDRPDTDRDLSARQGLAAVRAAIATLPDRQRQALLLRVIAEMDTAMIADTLGTSAGSVEQLLVRARATLRKVTGADLTLD